MKLAVLLSPVSAVLQREGLGTTWRSCGQPVCPSQIKLKLCAGQDVSGARAASSLSP